jgi:hypothetical protein
MGESRNEDSVSIREYFERIFEERQAALELAFKAQQEALGLASRTLELRLEKLNDLRQEVTRDRESYITRDVYDADQKITEAWRNQMQGGMNLIRFLGVGGTVALGVEILHLAGIIK